jgi:hypothetical protein
LDDRPPSCGAQGAGWHPPLGRPPAGALCRGTGLGLLVAENDLAGLRQALSCEDGLNHAGIDPSVLLVDTDTDRLELEQKVLLRNAHLPGEVFDSNLSH